MYTWYIAELRKMIPNFFKFSFEMASIGRLLHATIVIHLAGYQMANSDAMAIHGLSNDKDFSLGTDCLPFPQLKWST